MSLSTRGHWLVELVDEDNPRKPVVARFHVHSKDIGCTQGTTIYYRGGIQLAGRYKPHTRHWDRALSIAEVVLKDTMAPFADQGYSCSHIEWRLSFREAMKKYGCTEWDGKDLDDGSESLVPEDNWGVKDG